MKTQEGFALPVVIFTMAIMGLLAVMSLRTANDEHRSSRALRESGAALYAAEAGANVVRGTVTDTSGTVLDSITAALAPGDSADLGWLALPDGGSYRALIRRVDSGTPLTYTLTVEGRGAGLWGGQRAITMALTAPPSTTFGLDLRGAMGMHGPDGKPTEVKFSGGSFVVRGNDTQAKSVEQNPANLPDACSAPTSENKLGLQLTTAKSEGEVTAALPNNKEGSFKGLKPGSTTNEFTEQNSFAYDTGGMTRDEIIALADALKPGATVIPPGNYSDNFATPASPGVFLADGNLSLGGSGAGYGILIVTGELTVTGSFTWEGLILVVGLGMIHFTGSDNKVFGAVLAVSLKGGTILELGGNGGIYYSTQALCRIMDAGLLEVSGGSGLRVVSGSWMQL